MGMKRTHISLPEELLREIDRFAGKRKRSQFIEEAVRDKVLIARQREALEKSAGILNPDDYPKWSTSEKTSEWVRRMRREDDRRMVEKLRRAGVEVPPMPEESDAASAASGSAES